MLKAQERAEYDRLRQSEAQLLCEVAAKRRELETFQAESSARMAAAEQELAGLRAELQRYAGLQTKYKAIQDENRSLYNTVQDLRGSIRVFCRVRPAGVTGDNSASVVEIGDDGAVAVYSHKHSKWQEYKFDRVFGESSTQREVYAETKPLVRSVLDGENSALACHAFHLPGKSYTLVTFYLILIILPF